MVSIREAGASRRDCAGSCASRLGATRLPACSGKRAGSLLNGFVGTGTRRGVQRAWASCCRNTTISASGCPPLRWMIDGEFAALRCLHADPADDDIGHEKAPVAVLTCQSISDRRAVTGPDLACHYGFAAHRPAAGDPERRVGVPAEPGRITLRQVVAEQRLRTAVARPATSRGHRARARTARSRPDRNCSRAVAGTGLFLRLGTTGSAPGARAPRDC